jgi:hypothetical protein
MQPVQWLTILMFVIGCLFQTPNALASEAAATIPARTVESPIPAAIVKEFSLDPFYQKVVLADGFPIVGSKQVSDVAMLEAAYLTDQMLSGLSEVRQKMVENKVRLAIMARNEFTTDIPEHRTLSPKKYWDRRARGLGASRERPAVSCGEENLLCLPGDPYGKENILIHEFAHAIEGMGLAPLGKGFSKKLADTYAAAMKEGLWKGKYAASNPMEYWAEAVQSWYDTNRENDHDHNHVNTRDELKQYDPRIAKLVEEVHGNGSWKYVRPESRTEKPHFKNYDVAKEKPFAWPEGELWNEKDLLNPDKKLTDLAELKAIKPKKDEKAPASVAGDGKKSQLITVNRTGKFLAAAWIDEKGEIHPRGELPDGRLEFQDTYDGHVFAYYDDAGNLIASVRAVAGDCRVILDP